MISFVPFSRTMTNRGQYVGSELVRANGESAIVTVCIGGVAYIGTWDCSCGASADRAFGHHVYSSAMDLAKADCLEHCKRGHL
jgi:hypothetical protein